MAWRHWHGGRQLGADEQAQAQQRLAEMGCCTSRLEVVSGTERGQV